MNILYKVSRKSSQLFNISHIISHSVSIIKHYLKFRKKILLFNLREMLNM